MVDCPASHVNFQGKPVFATSIQTMMGFFDQKKSVLQELNDFSRLHFVAILTHQHLAVYLRCAFVCPGDTLHPGSKNHSQTRYSLMV